MTETIVPIAVGADVGSDTTNRREESQPRILHVPGFLDMFLALSADTADANAGDRS